MQGLPGPSTSWHLTCSVLEACNLQQGRRIGRGVLGWPLRRARACSISRREVNLLARSVRGMLLILIAHDRRDCTRARFGHLSDLMAPTAAPESRPWPPRCPATRQASGPAIRETGRPCGSAASAAALSGSARAIQTYSFAAATPLPVPASEPCSGLLKLAQLIVQTHSEHWRSPLAG